MHGEYTILRVPNRFVPRVEELLRRLSLPPETSDADRFWARVRVGGPDDCWLWLGNCDRRGYGRTSGAGRERMAHRVAYELRIGPIPSGLTLDHLCRVTGCVNPAHLEPVTAAENTRRRNALQYGPVCAKGHPYTPENTRWRIRGKKKLRICRTCAFEYDRQWRERRKSQ